MGRGITFVLPILTLLLGIAIGKWWSDRDHAAQRGRDQAARSTERRLAAPPNAEEPRRAEPPTPSAPAPVTPDPVRRDDSALRPLPGAAPSMADPTAIPKVAADATRADSADVTNRKKLTDPEGPQVGGNEEAAAKMLAVLFTNPAFRDRIVDQMVAQVGQRVTFTDSQREAAKKELAGAIQPLVDLFQKGPVDMKDLDPKFQLVKEDWKRRVTPLLTAEQGLAFQKWLDEKHSLQVKMGMDEKGDPVDPDRPEDK